MTGDVKVAAMSPAVELGGGLLTGLHGGYDLLTAVLVAGSFEESKVWRQYYRTLLFGRNSLDDPRRMADADAILGPDDDSITAPPPGMTRAHTRDLRRWTLDDAPRLPPDRLRFFIGLEDSLFSTGQTRRFARNFGAIEIWGYPGQGHLLFESYPPVFDDILTYFEVP
jgi:pimeloyl-ACP methyl ester carboxylesterase